MRGKIMKAGIRFAVTVLLTTMLLMGWSILTEGMYLIGVPRIEDVTKVTISYPEAAEEAKEFSDREHMELAVKLTGFLRYSLFEDADSQDAPMMTITYLLEDGKSVSVSASRSTVWWHGKAHAIKDREMFIKLAEGVFFLNERSAA